MLSEQSRVLIVADDLLMRRILRMCLTENRVGVTEARSIREARKCLQHRRIDLLIIDAAKKSGEAALALCREVRDSQRQIGLLLVIDHNLEKHIVRVLESGANDYIAKPFRSGELIGRCHAVLRRTQESAAAERTSIAAGDAGVRSRATPIAEGRQSRAPHADRIQSAYALNEQVLA